MNYRRLFLMLLVTAALAGAAGTAYWTRERWRGWLRPTAGSHEAAPRVAVSDARVVKLSPQARRNLDLVAKPVRPQSYWRSIQVPGVIEDRPGFSDRGVIAPAASAVVKVHAFPGDTLRPGDRLFTLRLISEYLQQAQSELFKTTGELQIVREQRERIKDAAKSGVLAESRLIDLENQLRRLATADKAHRQDLLTRGLTPPQIDGIANGQFVTEIEILAPPPRSERVADAAIRPLSYVSSTAEEFTAVDDAEPARPGAPAYEVQELKVELGQQVQAGQTLCLLSNHQSLYIKGHAFKREAPWLERAAQHGWPVRVEFAEDDAAGWPALDTTFAIRHLANSVDPASRTFAFFIPLTNQSRAYENDGRTFLVWRFRPGQRVRLHVPVEEMENVFAVPAEAVVREGPEAFVFRQNGDLFDRRPIHVLHEDRLSVVFAADGSVPSGTYLAQGAAASLNRVLKSQTPSSGGLPPGFHMHADGSLHGPH